MTQRRKPAIRERLVLCTPGEVVRVHWLGADGRVEHERIFFSPVKASPPDRRRCNRCPNESGGYAYCADCRRYFAAWRQKKKTVDLAHGSGAR